VAEQAATLMIWRRNGESNKTDAMPLVNGAEIMPASDAGGMRGNINLPFDHIKIK